MIDEEIPDRGGAAHTLGRGVRAAPVLRQGFVVTLMLAVIGAAGRVVIPIVIQYAIDNGLKGAKIDVTLVARACIIGAVAIIVANIAKGFVVTRLGMASEKALYDLRIKIIEHIHRLSLADHSEERRGALVSRVTSDVETLAEFFSWGGLTILLNGAVMLLVAAVMLSYDWLLALVAFVVSAPLAWALKIVQKHLVAAYELTRAKNGEFLGSVTELVTGAETLRAYNAGGSAAKKTKRLAKERADVFIRAGNIGAFLFTSGEVFSVLTVGAVVGVGLLRGPGGSLTAGSMVGFVFLTYRFLEPVAEFTEVLDQTQTAVAGMRRLLAILDMPVGPPQSAHPEALPAGPLAIEVRDVTFAYRSRGEDEADHPVLIGVSAHIKAGQQVAVVGATGSGKTTLGRLLARLSDPMAGQICLGGVPLTKVANADLRQRLIVVPQEPFLFDDTISANLLFARPETSVADLLASVRALDLDDWLDALPDGLQTPVGERGSQLSAGERQLVALIRASLGNPDVLILDEATSSVDALTEVRMSHALEKLSAGRTTISIAHRMSTAMRADRVLVLDQGRLVEDGTHEQLLRGEGLYASLFAAWVSSTTSNG